MPFSFAVNQHLRLSETIDVTSAGTTFSHGGGFITRYSSFDLGYELFYIASQPDKPFQQAMVFDARIQLPRDYSLHAASSIGPTGLTQYTVQLTTMFARNSTLADPISQGGLGINVIQGKVVDELAMPVEGAALRIGKQRIYSGPDGAFFYREKHARSHSFDVLVDEFVGMGSFAVRAAPRQVKSGREIEANYISVIICRLPAGNVDTGNSSFLQDPKGMIQVRVQPENKQ